MTTEIRNSADDIEFRQFGKRFRKVDGDDKVTGRAQFGADFTAPGSLFGKIVRSPYAHAKVIAIDTSAAEALPGVEAVCTAADFPSDVSGDLDTGEVEIGIQFMANLIMGRRKVLFEGHPVAAVAANDSHIAEEAARLIKVDYEVLPAVTDPIEAMSPDAPLLHEGLVATSLSGSADTPSNIAGHMEGGKGDVEKGFAESDVVIERTYRTALVHQGYLEPEAETVHWRADGHIDVWANSQGSFPLRQNMSNLLGVEVSKIKVTPLEVGGAFGAKNTPRVTPVAAILSRKSGKPVKIVLTREEVLKATGPASGAVVTVKVGATKDGVLKAAQARLVFGAGGFPGSPVLRGMQTIFACYQPENSRVDAYDVVTNAPRVAAYRAPGATVATFSGESTLDDLAHAIGMDPIDFRIKNAAKTGDSNVDDEEYTRIGIVQMLDAVRKSDEYNRPVKVSKNGWPVGRGVGIGWWPCGIEISSARLMVNHDGGVDVTIGAVDLHGVRTGTAQVAAETLGIEPNEVNVHTADTENIPYTGNAAGSRITRTLSQAVYKAGVSILDQMKSKMARRFGVEKEYVEYKNGYFFARDNQDSKVSFKEAGSAVTKNGSNVVATASNDPTMRSANGYAMAVADVEVDPDTGKVQLTDFTLFQDVGKCVNPTQVENQMQGGAVQGIGWALSEEYVYDDQGQMRNASFLDYRMPTALDLPMINTVILETPADDGAFGIRGVGEPPIIPPPAAIGNAIHDAIGVRMNQLPMSPERVFEAMNP
ncbi:MAG: xanthine dehydrogenase family protein molybdopterin-binding subunit [SAR202 cluster bacterium]|nr:oxidoreductase [Chloroflexota bacterium]MQG87731.1 xanthine dehydrogenase family protein molybdopterin-binding subunit [SAR202 cluster bacterium]